MEVITAPITQLISREMNRGSGVPEPMAPPSGRVRNSRP